MTTVPLTPPTSSISGYAIDAGVFARPILKVVAPIAVFAAYAFVTALIFWPWIVHPHWALIGPPEDNINDFWNTWYVAVAHDPAHFYSTKLLRFPEGASLIYQSFAYPQLLAVEALSHIFGTDLPTLVALQNFTLLASFPLAGLGAFYLVRHFARSTVGALLGGFVFAFNPSHIAHALHHAGVSSIEFLPIFALVYLLALERRSIVWLLAASVCYALSALSCWYYLFYGAYFMCFQILWQRIRVHAWPRGWSLLAPIVCGLCAAAMVSPFIVPMILASGSSVYDGGGNDFVADLAGYLAFPPEHFLSGLTRGLYAHFSGYAWEATTYLGLVNIAALVWWFLRTRSAHNPVPRYVILGMSMFSILAMGEWLHVAGISTVLPLPDAVLDKLPFFANIRSPSRAIVFVYLFMAIGIGCAAQVALRGDGIARRLGVGVAGLLILLDFYPAHLTAAPLVCSRGLGAIEADPERGFGVFNLPISYADEDTYMLDQICDHRPLIDGMISREAGQSLIDRLALTDLGRQRVQLARAHVKYLVIHRPHDGLYAWNKFLPPIAEFLRTYRQVYSGPDLIVLRVY